MTRTVQLFLLRATLTGLACLLVLASSMGIPWHVGLEPVAGLAQPRPKQTANVGTPVPLPGSDGQPAGDDPLDGDPLDGSPPQDDPDAPRHEAKFAIERSGRPDAAPSSLLAYDGDPNTAWAPESDGEEPWLWLDLGDKREVREVRWLARGAGTIGVSVSNDRAKWQQVDVVEVGRGWQGVPLRDDARYVRLLLQTADNGELPEVAEVAVYGQNADQSAVRAQKAKNDGKDKKRKKDKDRKDKASNADSNKSDKGGGKSKSSGGNKSGEENKTTESENVSAQAGETDCEGKRARCQTREGTMDIEDDCVAGGTCTIDVQADGGDATCDATGGDESKAGRGKGKRGADGGRCDAVADGGAVTIGDINP
jgi:hypothetical protein